MIKNGVEFNGHCIQPFHIAGGDDCGAERSKCQTVHFHHLEAQHNLKTCDTKLGRNKTSCQCTVSGSRSYSTVDRVPTVGFYRSRNGMRLELNAAANASSQTHVPESMFHRLAPILCFISNVFKFSSCLPNCQ